MKTVTTRKSLILISIMFFVIFLIGCSTNFRPSDTLGNESPDIENTSLDNVDKAVYLKRIYEIDGKIFLEFDDVDNHDDNFTSLPIAKDVKVFLPNYYPEELFAKLQRDLKDPNNKNIKDVLYYLTVVEGEVQAIKRQ